MLPPLLLVLAILATLSVIQPNGLDLLRVSVAILNGRVLTVLDVLIAIVLVLVMVALRGAIAFAGVLLFALWGMSILGVARIEGVPIPVLVVFIIILGGVVQVMSHWARR